MSKTILQCDICKKEEVEDEWNSDTGPKVFNIGRSVFVEYCTFHTNAIVEYINWMNIKDNLEGGE